MFQRTRTKLTLTILLTFLTAAALTEPKMLVDDGRRDAAGNCLGESFLFSGKAQSCRVPGVANAFKNCCESDAEVFMDSTGSMTSSYVSGKAISATFTAASKAAAAYQAAAAAGQTAQAAATAASDAALNALSAAFGPVGLSVMAVSLLVTTYLAKGCNEEEVQTAILNASKYCVRTGKKCVKKGPTGCLQKAKTFCCFNSKLARIIHEQGRQQLKDFDGFGGEDNPNCRGFTPEEFQSLDFSQIDFSEYTDAFATKSQSLLQANIKESVEAHYENLTH